MKKQIAILALAALTLTGCAGITQGVRTIDKGVSAVTKTAISIAEGAEKAVNTGLAAAKETAAVPTATTVSP